PRPLCRTRPALRGRQYRGRGLEVQAHQAQDGPRRRPPPGPALRPGPAADRHRPAPADPPVARPPRRAPGPGRPPLRRPEPDPGPGRPGGPGRPRAAQGLGPPWAGKERASTPGPGPTAPPANSGAACWAWPGPSTATPPG